MEFKEEVVVTEEVKAPTQESISSDSESEGEAEYHPNVSVSISHTQIPEENEEEEEQEKKEESNPVDEDVCTPDASALPAEISQPVEETHQAIEESRTEDTQAEEKTAEDEKDGEHETEGSMDELMMTPEEAPNGLSEHEEAVAGLASPAEEEEEPKMNGESPLVEAELQPQVICCSEVKSSLGRLWSFPGLWPLLPTIETPTFFPSCLLPCQFSFSACVNI